MISNVEIGKRLKSLRENVDTERGNTYSQDKLIELLHLEISQNMLSNIERGKTAAPLDVLVKYSEHFGVSLDKLITGKDFVPPVKEKKQETFADIIKAFFLIDEYYPIVISENGKISFEEIDENFQDDPNSTCGIRKEIIESFLGSWNGIKKADDLVQHKIPILQQWKEKVIQEGEGLGPDFTYRFDIYPDNVLSSNNFLFGLQEIRNIYYSNKDSLRNDSFFKE